MFGDSNFGWSIHISKHVRLLYQTAACSDILILFQSEYNFSSAIFFQTVEEVVFWRDVSRPILWL